MPDPILIVMHQETSTPGRVGHALRKRGYALDMRRPRFGDALPDTLGEHAGAIIFGGPMSANDEDDFIRREIDCSQCRCGRTSRFSASASGRRCWRITSAVGSTGTPTAMPRSVIIPSSRPMLDAASAIRGPSRCINGTGRASICRLARTCWRKGLVSRAGLPLWRLGVRAAISSRCDSCDDVQVDHTRTRPHAAAERKAPGSALRGSPRL